MGSLNTFKSFVNEGIARNSHFLVELNLPASLQSEPFISKREKIITFCDQVQLPGISFGTNQVRSYGEFYETPYEKLFEQITMSFYVDTEMVVKSLFDSWMELIQNPITRDFSYLNDYTTDRITIYVEDTMSFKRYKVDLFKCYPKAIAPIQLDYAARDIMKLSVTFVYKYFRTMQNRMDGEGQTTGDVQITNYGANVDGMMESYFADFNEFQNDVSGMDFLFDGVRTAMDGIEGIPDAVFGDPLG